MAAGRSGEFDLIVLDLGLPGRDGLSVLRELRSEGIEIPVIILTARDSIDDLVGGLDSGADDYIAKPFRFDELLARIRSRLRESAPTAADDPAAWRRRCRSSRPDGWNAPAKPVELTAREFLLAETFLTHPGQVLSRQQLLSRVWGYDFDGGSNVVDVYVGYLRRKLGTDIITTVRGVGYRLGDATDR